MTSFSLDPCFEFTIYAMKVYFHIQTWAPHKLLEVGKKKAKSLMPRWGSKNTTYTKRFEITIKGEGKLCFYFKKILKCFSNWLDWRKMVICFKLFHSSTAQSFMVDTLNPAVHAWLGMVHVVVQRRCVAIYFTFWNKILQ